MRDNLTVMMLTWEFPPRIIGGISPHVYHLSKNLAKNGIKVYVVTCDFPGAKTHEIIDDVEIFRIDSYKNPSPDFATWAYLMNMNMQKEVASIVNSLDRTIDIFHIHDWLVANAGIGLKHVYRKPLLVTIHSTELGRRSGLNSDYERMIHETEAWLTYEAWKVICCSNYMVSHVQKAFGLKESKIVMIPNGVSLKEYKKSKKNDKVKFRAKFALPEEKIVLFVGRLVYEKGIHVFINAVPKVLQNTDTKFVIVGDGYMKEPLLNLIKKMNLSHKVMFTGFVDEKTLRNLQQCADVSVVPSLFEPFGIVALEAMAAKSPVVCSDTGGLSEIIEHNQTGVKVYPNNQNSLSWGITKVLNDKEFSNRLKTNAYKTLKSKYNWDNISQKTIQIYKTIEEEYSKVYWV
jgi:glycosyltransferase involved in cell wall biosynthesis